MGDFTGGEGEENGTEEGDGGGIDANSVRKEGKWYVKGGGDGNRRRGGERMGVIHRGREEGKLEGAYKLGGGGFYCGE